MQRMIKNKMKRILVTGGAGFMIDGIYSSIVLALISHPRNSSKSTRFTGPLYIGTRFKAWRQSLNLSKVFKGMSNEDHYESLILAALIQ